MSGKSPLHVVWAILDTIEEFVDVGLHTTHDETLGRQRGRVMEEIERHRREFKQIAMDFGNDEGGRQQLEANMRHRERRLGQFDIDIEHEHEPERIRHFYDIQRTQVEPVGLVYLWPETN